MNLDGDGPNAEDDPKAGWHCGDDKDDDGESGDDAEGRARMRHRRIQRHPRQRRKR